MDWVRGGGLRWGVIPVTPGGGGGSGGARPQVKPGLAPRPPDLVACKPEGPFFGPESCISPEFSSLRRNPSFT